MPLPTMSVRVAPEHQPVIRDIATALRTRPELVNVLRNVLQTQHGITPRDTDVLQTQHDSIAERDKVALAAIYERLESNAQTSLRIMTFAENINDRLKALEAAPRNTDGNTDVLQPILDRLAALEERGTGQEAPQTVAEGAGMVLEASEALEPLEGAQEAPGRPQTRRKWTEADNAALRAIAARGGIPEDASHELGRPSSVISGKWRALGLPVQPRAGRKVNRRKTV